MPPNFLIIVADDLGFTDLGAFGGEIDTPNLDKLAANGARFTDFHTALACLPTRLMLFSGTDNHIAGLGQMAEFAQRHPAKFGGKPGYEGYLNDRVAPLPEILRDHGYYTFILGKWHLGLQPLQWPLRKGFERSFTLLPGAGNHYKYFPRDAEGKQLAFLPPLYAEDDRAVDADTELDASFYSTDHYTTRALEFLDSDARRGRPFFGCLTYTAPHWPYQAPRDRIDKYKGVYDGGPEELRQRRLALACRAGVVPPGVEPHVMQLHRDRRWHQLTAAEQAVEARIMETYAAMVDVLDENVGRVVRRLEKTGELASTVVMFMLDNGAEGMLMEALPLLVLRIRDVVALYYDNLLANIGNANSWVYYSDQWAQAATAPLYMHKMWASEGGIRCPLIVHYPPLVTAGVSGAFATVMDVVPTVLELAGVAHPGTRYKGRDVAPVRGRLWVAHLGDPQRRIHPEDAVTGWELFGQQAVRRGPYKALYVPAPFGPAAWQLFDVRADPGETRDLAPLHPAILQEMLAHWAEYVADTGLIEFGSDFFDAETLGEHDTVNYIECE